MDPKKKENNFEEELKTQTAPDECTEEVAEKEETQEEEVPPLTEEERLAQELEKANELIEEQKDKFLRLSAEFDNYRKRTMKEKAELILNGSEKSISSILPVVDDFERALKNMETATDVAAVREGVELIYNKFMSVLEKKWSKSNRNERTTTRYRLSRSYCRYSCTGGSPERQNSGLCANRIYIE